MAAHQPLLDIAEVRLHDTPLYNSIYRFDNEMLVNVHAYGLLAAYTPVFHLRRVDGQWFETYIESYERVWASARPYGEDDAHEPPRLLAKPGCPEADQPQAVRQRLRDR